MNDIRAFADRCEDFHRRYTDLAMARDVLAGERELLIADGKRIGFFAAKLQASLPKVPRLPVTERQEVEAAGKGLPAELMTALLDRAVASVGLTAAAELLSAPLLSQAERQALIGPDSLTARAGDGALAEEDAPRAAPQSLPSYPEPLVSAEERRALLPADGPADPTDPVAVCKAGWGSEHCPYPVGSKERKTWMDEFIEAMTSHPIEKSLDP